MYASLRYTLCPIYFRLMAAIFDFQYAQTCYCIHSSLYVLTDPRNMGVALEFRCYHVYHLRFMQLNCQSRHLGFLTAAYLFTAYCLCYNTAGVYAHEFSGFTVRISFLASVEHTIFKLFTFYLQIPVLSRHIS